MGTIYTEGQIVAAVRKALDENTTVDKLSDDENTLELEDIIKAQIASGINGVRAIAPLAKLEVKHVAFGSETTPVEAFKLPTDFLRLAVIYGRTWKTSVSEFTVPGTTTYLMQSSEFAGIKGSSSRPVAALTVKGWEEADGGGLKLEKTIELYPKTNGLLSYVAAVTEPEADAPGAGADGEASGTVAERTYDIEALIYDAVVLYIASIVCNVQMNINGAQLLRNMAMAQLGIKTESK